MIDINLLEQLKGIDFIDKKLILEVEQLYNDIEQERTKISDERKIQIASIGIYNAGKSTLLNALIDKSVFEIGDIPTTYALDKYETDNIIYLDTPGLNANQEDTYTAYEGYKDSDIFLFVSNIQSGGLSISESNYLNTLKNILGNKEILEKNIVFILTNKHQIDENEVEKIVLTYKNNIEKEIGIQANIFTCDSLSYETGKKENHDELIIQSGIPDIKNFIFKSFQKSLTSDIRNEKLLFKKKSLEDILFIIKTSIEEEINFINSSIMSIEEKTDNIKKFQLDFDYKINELIKSLKDKSIYSPSIYFEDRGTSWYSEKSKYKLEEKIRKNIERAYNNRDRYLNNAIRKFEEINEKYILYSTEDNNFYNQTLIKLNNYVSEYVKNLINMSLKIPNEVLTKIQYKTTEQMKELFNNLSYKLSDDVVRYSEYYSLDYYIDKVDIREFCIESRELLFLDFSEYDYSANTYDAINEMQKDLTDAYNNNCKFVVRDIKNIINMFADYIKNQIEEKKKLINNVINNISYEDNTVELTKLQNALNSINCLLGLECKNKIYDVIINKKNTNIENNNLKNIKEVNKNSIKKNDVSKSEIMINKGVLSFTDNYIKIINSFFNDTK